MTTERIKQIQAITGFPDSVSVQQALLQVWNECEQEKMIYAKAKFEEACEAQKKVCDKSVRIREMSCGDAMQCGCQGHCEHPISYVDSKSILNAPKPEFKP